MKKDTTKPGDSTQYNINVSYLRGVLALAVFAGHIRQSTGIDLLGSYPVLCYFADGSFAAICFFIISGFYLTGTFLKLIQKSLIYLV